MDWLKDFETRFGKDEEIDRLAAKKVHGYIQINFCDGRPMNYSVLIHKRIVTTATSVDTQKQL